MEEPEVNVLKVAYMGWNFHGSQIQPGLRTVEGVLEKVLGVKGKFLSRTDAGVSAVGNLYLLKEPVKLDRIKEKIRELLKEGIAVWAAGRGKAKVNGKVYLYILPFKPPAGSLERLKAYENLPIEKQPVKRGGAPPKGGFTVKIIPLEPTVAVVFEGPGFGYMQIRRIIGEVFFGGRTAPAEGLVLYAVKAAGIEWVWERKQLVKTIAEKWQEVMLKGLVLRLIRFHDWFQPSR